MLRRHRRIVELQAFQRARPEILDDDVRLRDELVEQRAPARMLEVERYAFLVSIDAEEVRALGSEKWRTPLTRVVAAARLFDLDDARAEVREQHCAIRSRENSSQVQNSNVVKRAHDS